MKAAVQLVAALLFVALSLIVYGHVFADGLCCADDSTNAIVAKNLAFGHGYLNSVPLDRGPGSRLFDPRITTGPALNLPAAVVISFVGNVPWAPGFATATVSLSLLLLTVVTLSRTAGPIRGAGYGILLMSCLYGVTAGIHMEHWYALLGELPAALLCVLGAAVLARDPDWRSGIFWSCLIYGLALMTKLVALLSAAPVAVWLVWRILAARVSRAGRAVDALWAALAFLAPWLAFQAWKIVVLGSQTYAVNVADFWRFFRSSDPEQFSLAWSSLVGSALQQYSEHALVLQTRFGLAPLVLVTVGAVAAVLVHQFVRAQGLRLLFALLMGGALMQLSWWFLLSSGRPRYALIGLFLYFAALACVVFIHISRLSLASSAAIMMLLASAASTRVLQPARFALQHRFASTPRVESLVKTATFLSTLPHDQPFIMGWWATAGDIEYAMPTVANFVQSVQIDQERLGDGRILVRNRTWVEWAPTPEFTALEARCDDVLLDAPPYRVSRCKGEP